MTITVTSAPTSDKMMANSEENGSGHVKVIVRVRPPNDFERNGQSKNVVEVMNENVLIFDPIEQSSPLGLGRKRRHRDIRKRRQKDMKFAFDRVFGWESANADVFEQSTRVALEGLLGGYNCSVFAYGATGAGKTFTMLGSASQPGVIYHTMINLYKHIDQMKEEKSFDIAVSYLEVYNEQIRDLLLPRGTLPIREDPTSGVIVPGLSLHKPSTADELLYMLQFGNKNRTQHPTDANAESSRSHAVFQVFVRQRDRTASLSTEVKVAKMCLVDLAGSERATVTKNRGARLREGANINRSLLALGNVINSLADHKSKGHIPYRDSKLTRLLKDSLGGNCRTIMIAAVSPSHLSYEDTYNTLKYADRAKSIRLDMKRNVLSVDFHVSRYGKIVEELRKEITELKSKLQTCEGPKAVHAQAFPLDMLKLQECLRSAYGEQRSLREQQLRQETNARDLQWRVHCKQKCLHRASQLSHTQPETVAKISGVVQALQRKLDRQEDQRRSLASQLQENVRCLHALHDQAAPLARTQPLVSQMLEVSVQRERLAVELSDSRHYARHLRRLARAQTREAVASETLISALLKLVQRQHLELQSRPGPVAPDVAAGYQQVCELVGEWGVSWAHTDDQETEDPFHINHIIDIPLLADNGAVLNGLASLEQPSSSTCEMGPKSNPVISCPGRVINGQVVFSATPSATVPQPPSSSSSSSSCLPPAAAPSYPQQQHSSSSLQSHTTPATSQAQPDGGMFVFKATSSTPGSLNTASAHTHTHAQAYNSAQVHKSGGGGLVSVVHAGYTPNPKKRRSWEERLEGPGGAVPSSAREPGFEPQGTAGRSCPPTLPAAPERQVSASHRLNETFSLEDLVGADQKIPVPTVDSVVYPNPPGLPSAPVMNSSSSSLLPSLAAQVLPSAEGAASVWGHPRLPAVSDVKGSWENPASNCGYPDGGILKSGVSSDCGGLKPVASGCSGVLKLDFKDMGGVVEPGVWGVLKPGLGAPAVAVSAHSGPAPVCDSQTWRSSGDVRHGTGGVIRPGVAGVYGDGGDGCTARREGCQQDKENSVLGGGGQHSHPAAKRAITFDSVACSPRVEVLSYADAVKTPTPPRQPLQALDNNSPQVFNSNLPLGLNQTPKSTGRSSMYLANQQAFNNMRRLKQMGMPSLVENLITGNKAGEATQGVAGVRPSYMLPTQATVQRAQRDRRLASTRDDTFQPRRVPQKTLAHSRSKSASALPKGGWKI